MWWSAPNPAPGWTSWPSSVAEAPPDIKALFFSPRTIWLLPNDLVRSQFQNKFIDDIEPWAPINQGLESQASARDLPGPEALVFPLGRYPRLETFSSLEQALAQELNPPEMDDLGRRLILYDLARTLAAHLWPGRPRPAEEEEGSPAAILIMADDDKNAVAPGRGDGAERLVDKPIQPLAGQKSHFLPGYDLFRQADQAIIRIAGKIVFTNS